MKKQFFIGIIIGGIIALAGFLVWRIYFVQPTNTDNHNDKPFSCWYTPPAGEKYLKPYRWTNCSEEDQKACIKSGGQYGIYEKCSPGEELEKYMYGRCVPKNITMPRLIACDLGIGGSDGPFGCECGVNRCWNGKKCIPADAKRHPIFSVFSIF